MRSYKYSAKFQAFAKVIPPSEDCKKLAQASLKQLGGLFPGLDLEKNPDLLYIASNLILLNYANLNDDCVLKSDMLAIQDKFIDKYIDIEHNRDDIVGAIDTVGFSLFGSDELITLDEAKTINAPIQLVIGGYIWAVVAPELARYLVSASDEKSPTFGDLSTSFELMFDNYNIGYGFQGNRDADNAVIFAPDSPEFAKYDQLLRANGGSGVVNKDGDVVYRILQGDILPVGAGIVAKPASGIKGIYVAKKSVVQPAVAEPIEESKAETSGDNIGDLKTIEPYRAHLIGLLDQHQKAIEVAETEQKTIIISQQSVKPIIKHKIMDIQLTSITQLDTDWTELRKLDSAASIKSFIADEIAKKSEEFSKELKAKEEIVKTVEANKANAEAKSVELQASVEALTKQVDEMKAVQAAAIAEEQFNTRMAAFDEEFELDDEDRALLVEDIKELASEEAFAKYMKKSKKLMKNKKKGFVPFKKKSDDDKKPDDTDKNGVDPDEPDADDAKKKAKAALDVKSAVASITEESGQSSPTNGVAAEPSLREQYFKAFSEGTTIRK